MVALLALGAILLFLWYDPSLVPYESLAIALRDPGRHESILWTLSVRNDGAGWLARQALAELLISRGECSTAEALLREALNLLSSPEVERLLALALEKQGKREEALAQWAKLLPQKEAIDSVVRLSGDPVKAGEILIQGRAYSAALDLLAQAKGEKACLLRARALTDLGRYAEAAGEYERYLATFPATAQIQLEYGQVLERLGQTQKAMNVYKAAGADGAYYLGLLLEEQGALDEALSAYLRAGSAEAKWRAARILESQGRVSEALTIYQELAEGSARLADDAALRAYLILSRQGRAAEASKFKNSLSPAFLWLLGEPVPPLSTLPDPPKEVPDVVRLADALLARFPEKGREWAHITLEIALSPATPSEALAIGQWYAKEGDWRWAYTVGVKVLSLLPCPRAYRLAYPKAWEESVLHWAQEYQVDPILIWAVMREESGFLPTAVSSSGARGLMQLLPSTAHWIAEEKLHIPYREELLFEPNYNIRLGTWYLRYLLDQFGGNTAWAVAAYNAGPGNIRRWTEKEVFTLPDLPGALRSIETREYLVKVLNSWLVYRELYGGLR